jgi:hypothetical protein
VLLRMCSSGLRKCSLGLRTTADEDIGARMC